MPDRLRIATVALLESVPGLVHGFEQRLAQHEGETREAARERIEQALSGAGRLRLLKQVHGCTVRTAPWSGRPEGDAGLALAPGELLGIEAADCLPVLLADPVQRRVAAAHAGWRGSAAGVAIHALRALVEAGTRPSDVLAALGPCIGPCCYEVGEEVREAFGEVAEGVFRPGPRGRVHLDLQAANRDQLLAAGLRASGVAALPDCTRCHPQRYHSYRRDGRAAGRMISYVGFSAAGDSGRGGGGTAQDR